MIKAAFVGFGEVNTPIDIIIGKCKAAEENLRKEGLDLISVYPVTDDYEEKDIKKAVDALTGKDFDLLICCVAGWIPTHAVVKVTEHFREKPMVLWGLCGWYEDGHLITTADQAGTSAARIALQSAGYTFKYVYDVVKSPSKVNEVISYCSAAALKSKLKKTKIGQMGYRDMQLYGTQFDGLAVKRDFGIEIECFEMLEVVKRSEKLSEKEIEKVVARIKKWKFLKTPDENAVKAAAKYYLAIKQIADERKYAAISLKDVDGFKKLLGFPPAPVFTLLAEDGICTIPENDCMGNITQVVVKGLTGQIGAYLEFYEYFNDGVLAGVPDYIPKEIVDGETTILPAAFGELSQGLLNVSKAKQGELTMCRLACYNGKFTMHIVKGVGKTPETWEECGWDKPAPQLPGLKIELDDTEDFANKVLGQHYIISYGDNVKTITEYCKMNGIAVE